MAGGGRVGNGVIKGRTFVKKGMASLAQLSADQAGAVVSAWGRMVTERTAEPDQGVVKIQSNRPVCRVYIPQRPGFPAVPQGTPSGAGRLAEHQKVLTARFAAPAQRASGKETAGRGNRAFQSPKAG